MVDILDDDFLLVPVRQTGGSMQTVNTAHSANAVGTGAHALAQKALTKSQWRQERDSVRSRALDILIGHFSGSKSNVETRNLLMQTIEKGGAGMTPAEADAFVEAIASVTSETSGNASSSFKPPMPQSASFAITPKKTVSEAQASVVEKTSSKANTLPVRSEPTVVMAVKQPTAAPVIPATQSAGKQTKEKTVAPVQEKKSAVSFEKPSVTHLQQRAPSQSKNQDVPKMESVKPSVSVPVQKKTGDESAAVHVQGKSETPVPAPQRTLPASRDEAIAMLTNEITQALAFRLPDQYAQDRLRFIVASRLREIRDWHETEEVLAKPIASGGLGLSHLDIERVRVELEGRVKEIENMLAQKQKTDVRTALQNETKVAEMRKEEKKREDSKEVENVYKKVLSGEFSKDASASSEKQKGSVQAPAPVAPIAPSVPKTMTDIHPPQSSLVGPVEELRRMTLVDFRKLSSDPKEAVRKIQDKLTMLEQQAFTQKLAGAHALKQSEVYTLYYTMVRTSVMKSIPVTTVIHDRSGEALPVLTEAEFGAIMELSRALRV